MKINLSDTICAIATQTGGALNIIRISGQETLTILKKIFKSREFSREAADHRLYYGYIGDNGIADEVMVGLMLAPRSYTREDTAEISCHGGFVSAERVLELVIRSGARLAERGEFTRRAFVNGRIDLSQAEAVGDIIGAKTALAQSMALSQLRGKVSEGISSMRSTLMRCFATIEASIDYPENDTEEITVSQLSETISKLVSEIREMIERSRSGELIKNGVDTVILGTPNVGKSSLLNALLKADRAIITEIAGTTRDVVREYAVLDNGVMLRLSDTAGIRETGDRLELMGIEKSKDAASGAQLILAVFDGSRELDANDRAIIDLTSGKNAIYVINKSDAPQMLDGNELNRLTGGQTYRVSAKTGAGLGQLCEAIKSAVFSGGFDECPNLVSNRRHIAALAEAEKSLCLALSSLKDGFGSDIAVIDIENAYRQLGLITGESVDEDLCDKIFAEFCLGK